MLVLTILACFANGLCTVVVTEPDFTSKSACAIGAGVITKSLEAQFQSPVVRAKYKCEPTA